jgi:hypothetical protein
MQLFVKTLTGATLTLDVEGTCQVNELKYVSSNFLDFLALGVITP